MYGYIYKTTNLVNGKIYIGQKKSDKFLGEQYLGSGKILKQAITKYGQSNFKVILLEECQNKIDLNQKEIYWISKYNSINKDLGYNIAECGQGGGLGKEVNQKISLALIGRKLSEETKQKLRVPKSEETKLKLSNSHKGKHLSDEHKKKISESNKGKPSPSKGKIAWNRGIPRTNEVKQAISNANKGNKYRVGLKHSVQTIEKMRAKALLRKKRFWYNNGITNIFILPEQFSYYESLGYIRGRLKKW